MKKKQKPESIIYSLYDSCDVLTLDRFERAYIHHDLNALKKDETQDVPEGLLAMTWDAIQVQYMDQSPNEGFNEYASMRNDMLKLKLRVNAVKILVDLVKFTEIGTEEHDLLMEALKGWGYNEKAGYLYDIENVKDGYLRDLNRVIASLADAEIQINNLTGKIAAYEKQHKGDKLTTGFFDANLTALSKYMGFRVSKQKVTVTEYNSYLRDMHEHYKTLSKQKVNGR